MYQLFYEKSGAEVLLQWRGNETLSDKLKAAGISSQVKKPPCEKYDALTFAMIEAAAFERIRKIGAKYGDELRVDQHNGTGNNFRSSFESFSEIFKPEKKPEKAASEIITTKYQAGNRLDAFAKAKAKADGLGYAEAFAIIADQTRKFTGYTLDANGIFAAGPLRGLAEALKPRLGSLRINS